MSILLLGEPSLRIGQTQRPLLLRKKLLLVLSALALAGPQGIRREKLASMLWMDRQDAQAKSSLRQSLTALRKFLVDMPDLHLVTDGDMVHLSGSSNSIDVFFFQNTTSVSHDDKVPSQDLAQAADLYRGPFLDGVSFDGAGMERFTIDREMLRDKAASLVECLSKRAGLEDVTARLAHRLLSDDPLLEEAHRALIRIALSENKVNRARKQLEICRKVLQDELDVAPEPGTIALLVDYDRDAPDAPKPVAPSWSLSGTVQTIQERPSIAVLPFIEMGKTGEDFFVDGIVDELTTSLARMRELFVVSRQSAFTYKGRAVDSRTIGEELGVSYIVEGTVQRSDTKLRVNVQLVDAVSSKVQWTTRYENSLSDLFDLQVTVAQQIAGAILPSVRNVEIKRVGQQRPENLDAYGTVLQAYPKFWAQSKKGNQEAIVLFGKALEKDPTYGHAMAMKAWCHAQQTCYLWSDRPDEERKLAMDLARDAAKHVGDDATALAALSATYAMVSSDSKTAWHFNDQCLAIDPCNAWGWMRAGWLHVLTNEPRKGLECLERSESLSPMDPLLFNVYFGKGLAWASLREFDRAIEMVYKGMHAGPSVTWAYRILVSFYSQTGQRDKMANAISQFQQHYPNVTMAQIRGSLPPSMVESNARYLAAMEAAGIPKQ